MRKNVTINNWQFAMIPNTEVVKGSICLTTPQAVAESGTAVYRAEVPGNFELDLMREGLLDDVYMGANSVKTQELENRHLYYFTTFHFERIEGHDAVLCFEGIDTVAEIFLDGEKLGFVENMLHAHRFNISKLAEGEHTLLVHIIPVTIYARQFEVPAMCFGLKYNHDALQVRKAMSMFGWDIMPRIVSGGLWKPVFVEYLPCARIENPFTFTRYKENEVVLLETRFRIHTDADYMTDYKVVLRGKCKDSEFEQSQVPFGAAVQIVTPMHKPYFWWPKNYGEPNLYDMELVLYYKGVEVDRVQYRTGVRTVWIKRTSRAGDDGDFCFIVNGKRIFVLGTNWVPCDAFPSRHDEYTLRNIRLADESGCNMIRCWGGNVYPSELLYDYCDEHGIMIWQDFSLACGHYPDDERLCALVKEEVKQVAIKYRNHPALAVWAGDNECDCFVVPYWWYDHTENDAPAHLDPNLNKLTREIILRELRNHDASRPYLPSSPYVDETVYRYGMASEDHLWGPRDYFKGDFYGKATCHFASEIGYHGCPSPASIKKFIPEASLPQKDITEINTNGDWLVHAAGMETCVEDNPYAYRLPLMISQVDCIFTKVCPDLDGFARQSQISQAEAMKYFVEAFRVLKWRRTGILWWNIVDGWPQVSDAVVDWYGCKKLAYHYIKRSQTPFAMMCDEPKNGLLDVYAVNDTRAAVDADFEVVELVSGKTICKGQVRVESDGKAVAAQLPNARNAFYLIKWTTKTAGDGTNHFATELGEKWDTELYLACMKKAGYFEEFEGF